MKEKIHVISFSENYVENSKRFSQNIAMIYKIYGTNLLKSKINFHFKNQIMGIFEGDVIDIKNTKTIIDDILTEYKLNNFSAIYVDFFSENMVELISKLDLRAYSLGITLYVPHAYAKICKYANILIDTGISGGNLKSIIEYAKLHYGSDRISARISHNIRRFLIPNDDTQEEILKDVFCDDKQVFFSDNLYTNYYTQMIDEERCEFVIFDDLNSFKKKLELLDNLGISKIFVNFSDFSKYNI